MEGWTLAPPYLIGETVDLSGVKARVRWLGRVATLGASLVAGLEVGLI